MVDFNFEPAFKRLSRHCNHSPDEIKLYFMKSGLEVLYDGGKISTKTFYTKIKKDLKHKADFYEFKRIWNEIFTLKKPMIELLKKLKKSHRIVLISNTNAMHFEYIHERYDFFKHFDKIILSFKERVRKPDERIYKIAMQACRAKAHEIFYIDDREDLTSAARELGIHVFTFKNNLKELKSRMKAHKIL